MICFKLPGVNNIHNFCNWVLIKGQGQMYLEKTNSMLALSLIVHLLHLQGPTGAFWVFANKQYIGPCLQLWRSIKYLPGSSSASFFCKFSYTLLQGFSNGVNIMSMYKFSGISKAEITRGFKDNNEGKKTGTDPSWTSTLTLNSTGQLPSLWHWNTFLRLHELHGLYLKIFYKPTKEQFWEPNQQKKSFFF